MLRPQSAFSLIELMVVIAIVGVIAALATQRFGTFSRNAQLHAAASEFRQMDQAFNLYYAEQGDWPPDQHHGIYPPEMTEYLDRMYFDRSPALGEAWDWNPTWGPLQPSISIRQQPAPRSDWQALDQLIDDGNFNTGRVRRHNSRYLSYSVAP